MSETQGRRVMPHATYVGFLLITVQKYRAGQHFAWETLSLLKSSKNCLAEASAIGGCDDFGIIVACIMQTSVLPFMKALVVYEVSKF